MRRYFALFIALFFALPASAQQWDSELADPNGVTTWNQDFKYDFTTTGFSATLHQDVTVCDTVDVTLVSNGTPTAVTVQDCLDATVDSQRHCINLYHLPQSGDFGPVRSNFVHGYASFNVTDAGDTGGTLTLTCSAKGRRAEPNLAT